MWLIGPPTLPGENGVSGAWFLLFWSFVLVRGLWFMVGKHGQTPRLGYRVFLGYWLVLLLVGFRGYVFIWFAWHDGSGMGGRTGGWTPVLLGATGFGRNWRIGRERCSVLLGRWV